MGKWNLSPNRQLTKVEKEMIWKKEDSHVESDVEYRICEAVKKKWNRGEMKITNILLEGDAGSGKTQLAKALSANFGLPYTKITCFADMDKSDILGSILPVTESENQSVQYKYYPSEIVRAYENGWLLEIQEPTVIRDAAVLMALNSALEPDGSINLPTRIIHRHPDFVAVITTNRGYNGCRPLNEALRDRIHHAEKMDLPSINVMIDRAIYKTGCKDKELLSDFAHVIITLDKVAKANAIKGVAGMRSYFYWIDAVLQGSTPIESLYHKVIYKISTDEDEISILEQALKQQNLLSKLENIYTPTTSNTNEEKVELREDMVLAEHTEENLSSTTSEKEPDSNSCSDSLLESTVKTRQAHTSEDFLSFNSSKQELDSEACSDYLLESKIQTKQIQTDEDGAAIYHELSLKEEKQLQEEKISFRKQLNNDARKSVKGSIHEKIGMIVHRPQATKEQKEAYKKTARHLRSVIQELSKKTQPLLEYEVSSTFSGNRVYGTNFHAEKIASQNLRYFSRNNPPEEKPSLAVVLRIDQSASMNSFGRLEAAKEAAIAVNEFCKQCKIPVMICGDTADCTPKEKMSLYSYVDWEKPELNEEASLMGMKSISNNRDGMALRVLADKLEKMPQNTKLLISISDGQPKATPDYTGELAKNDMKQVLQEYSRKGIVFLAAAIGQDKETICDIYGEERFLDITNLHQLPIRLVQMISRYL